MKAKTKPKAEAAVIEIITKDWHHHSRNHFWYLGVAILVLVGAYVALMARDYIAMTAAIAVGIAIFRVAHMKPGARTIRISSRGVDWGGQFIAYHHLRAFWVANADHRLTIYLERLNSAATISFMVKPDEAEALVELLATHLPWHHHKSEPLGERFGRLLRI